ncbi:MAG: SDR family oxidoreductase [Sphingomonadales bacterium]|nr:SDR family oxidoreductase [Sphingomonadales bacterium]
MAVRPAIFITGAGSGIGRAVASEFARRGWFVGLADIDEGGMAETARLLPMGRTSQHRLDVRERDGWDAALADFAAAAGGRIDVVHNNAGVAFGGQCVDLLQREVDLTIDVNFRGVVYGAMAAYPWLKASAPGSALLNTASASALYGTGGMAVYSATKHAVRALTEALDTEWGDQGIRVRSIMPSFIDTPLLAGPAGANTHVTKRDRVIESGMEFTPVEEVARAAWDAVHGSKLHVLVGKTARQMGLAAKWAPGYLRNRAKKLMLTREGRE